MSEPNPYAPPNAAVADHVDAEAAPPLWNPTAAGSWSILFSPIFGAYLHMQNWKALGEPAQAAKSKRWLIASIVFIVVMGASSLFIPESEGWDALARVGGFVLLIVWYYAMGKSQQTYVAARFGKNYPRRGWAIPIAVAFGAFILYFLLFVLVGAALIATGVLPEM